MALIENMVATGALIGGLINVAAYFPQIFKMLKVKDSTGTSIVTWYLWLLAIVLVLLYAVYVKDWIFITLQTLSFLCISFMLFLIHKYKKGTIYEN